MLGIIIAIISGALMSVQGVFNTAVTQNAGIWVTSGFVQLTALIVCVAAWFFTGRDGSIAALFQVDHKYMLLGGAIGAFITFTVIKATASMGPAKAVIFIITAQLLASYAIELMGLFGTEQVPFSFRKLIGMVVIIAGVVIFKWETNS